MDHQEEEKSPDCAYLQKVFTMYSMYSQGFSSLCCILFYFLLYILCVDFILDIWQKGEWISYGRRGYPRSWSREPRDWQDGATSIREASSNDAKDDEGKVENKDLGRPLGYVKIQTSNFWFYQNA